jgi:hypothetical protein
VIRQLAVHISNVAGYSGQQSIEKVFRGFKDGDWLNWGPMYHWTDSKIRVHAFYCMLGICLLNYVRSQVQNACPQITIEQLKDELADIMQFVLLYPPQGEKGPYRTATICARCLPTPRFPLPWPKSHS